MQKRRFKQLITLQDRIIAWAEAVREQAAALPPGADREILLQKVRQAEAAMHLHEWVNSPELKPQSD